MGGDDGIFQHSIKDGGIFQHLSIRDDGKYFRFFSVIQDGLMCCVCRKIFSGPGDVIIHHRNRKIPKILRDHDGISNSVSSFLFYRTSTELSNFLFYRTSTELSSFLLYRTSTELCSFPLYRTSTELSSFLLYLCTIWKKSSKAPKRACAVCLALQWLYAVGVELVRFVLK